MLTQGSADVRTADSDENIETSHPSNSGLVDHTLTKIIFGVLCTAFHLILVRSALWLCRILGN